MRQNKTYMNKFLTGAITATMVATAVAPVGMADTTEFSDIQGYDEVTQSHIYTLVEAGIITGTSDTTFEPSKHITRGQVVKLLGRYLVNAGIADIPMDWNTEQRFSDLSVNFSDQDLVKNAAVVFEAGVFKGNNGVLNSSGQITRENMALVLDRAAKAITGTSLQEISADLPNNVTDINLAKEEAKGAIKALNALEISTVTEFKPKPSVRRVHFATFLSNTIDVIQALEEDVEEDTLQVEAVNLLNSVQIEVKFNETVDQDSVLDQNGTLKNNVFTLETYPGASPVAMNNAKGQLSDDGKTLTITVGDLATQKFQGRYDITIDGAKDLEQNVFAPYHAEVNFAADITGPSVTNFEQISEHNVQINFSEPMQSADAVFEFKDENGNTVNIPAVSITNDGDTSVVVDLTSIAVNKEVTVTIKNAKDIAGNLISPQPSTIVVQKTELPTFAPSINSVTQTGAKTFNIKFSEDVTLDTAIENITLSPANVITTIQKIASDEYQVTVTNNLTGITTVTVDANKVTNAYGQVAGTGTLDKSITFIEDTIAPSATVSLTTDSNNQQVLELTFDKDVKLEGNNEVKITGTQLLDHVTTTVNVNAVAVDYKNPLNKKVIHIPLSADALNVLDANYTVTIENNSGLNGIFSSSDVAMDAITAEFTRGQDGTPPSQPNTTKATINDVQQSADNDYIIVTFDQIVDAESATNVNHYTITDAAIESATIVSTDQKVVQLKLAKGSVTDSYERPITIENVAAKDSTVTMDPYTGTVNLTENVRPTLTAAAITNTNEITLTFSEAIDSVTPEAFVVKAGTATVAQDDSGATIHPTDNKKITITIADDFTNTELLETITVEPTETTANFVIKDLKGNKLEAFEPFTVVKP